MTKDADQIAACAALRAECHKFLLGVALTSAFALLGYTTGAYVFSYTNWRNNRSDFLAQDTRLTQELAAVKGDVSRADERAKVMQENYTRLESVINRLSDAVGKLEKAVVALEIRISPRGPDAFNKGKSPDGLTLADPKS